MRLAEEHFTPEDTPERLRLRAVALLDDDSTDVAVAAALFLGHAGDDRAKPLLRRVVRGEVDVQREDEREAVEITGALGMRDLVPDLERRAFGLVRHVRDTCAFHATIALARMGNERAVASIKKALGSRSEKRREAASIAASRAHIT
jgi:HEAT repeat protein